MLVNTYYKGPAYILKLCLEIVIIRYVVILKQEAQRGPSEALNMANFPQYREAREA